MTKPAPKCENYDILKQNITLELFIIIIMVYSCSFSLGGNLDFLDCFVLLREKIFLPWLGNKPWVALVSVTTWFEYFSIFGHLQQ